MRFEDLYRLISAKKYYVFSLDDVCLFFSKEKKSTVKQYLSRWTKDGKFARLRKGLYELVYPERRPLSDMVLANKIYSPSYVSLETALSHYNLIPEVAMAVVSITAKPTRRFKNDHGLFVYRSIQLKSFCGYGIENHSGTDVLIAEPEKALVDFLYFKTLRSRSPDSGSFRLDRKRVAQLNQKKIESYGRLYGMEMKAVFHAVL